MQHDDDPAAETGPIRRITGPPAADPAHRRARRARDYAGDSPARGVGGRAGHGTNPEQPDSGRAGAGASTVGARHSARRPGHAQRDPATSGPDTTDGTTRRSRRPATSETEVESPDAAHRAGEASGRADRTRRAGSAAPRHATAPPTGHGHGNSPAPPASRHVKLLLTWLLAPIALATVAGAVLLYPWGQNEPASPIAQGTPVHGTIGTATSGPCLVAGQVQVGDQPDPGAKPCLTVRVGLADGPGTGRTVELTVPIEPSTPRFSAGDDVVLAYNGGDAADPASYQLVDFQRGLPLAVLAALFAVAVVVLGRWQGLAALGALVLSFVVLVAFVLPAILAGESPLLVAIVGAGLIMFIALYLTHGLSARTSVAVLGTLASLTLIGALSAIFSAAAALTGLDDSTATLIASLGHGIDARGLLLAGIVIGALGVLDDVTVTQTSAVWELRRANPGLSWRELYSAGLRIGRDHVGSAVNTLVMAYAGAALPVMLYSSISGVGLGAILGSQDVAQEIVRTLAGSVGIVAAVPVTTVLAAMIASREPISHISHTSDH